jgi:hypothetical protein
MISPNAFINHPEQPTEKELTQALGSSRELWDKIRTDLASEYDVSIEEWNTYSLKAGWSLRLKCKKRNIVYLAPCSGHFRVAFILGDKAIHAVRAGKFPKRILKILDEATRYPEGTAIRINIKKEKDIEVVKKLVAVKPANWSGVAAQS